MIRSAQLLSKLATYSQWQVTAFSHNEVKKRLKELKYLSTQKTVPRLSIQKQLVQLEQQLSGIKDLERQVQRQKKHESLKVAAQKREIARLKKELALTQNPDMKKKVETLSHVLGDTLAQQHTEQAVKKAVIKEIPKKTVSATLLQSRIQAMKHELAIRKALSNDHEAIEKLEKQLALIEHKLGGKTVDPSIVASSDRHRILFNHTVPNQLPHLPPPKRKN